MKQSKQGVRTSLRDGEARGNSPKKDKSNTSQYTLGGTQTIVNRLPAQSNLTVEELNGTHFSNSISYHNERPQTHFNYGQGASSNFVPPPPERFLLSGSTQHSQLPINSNSQHHVQTFHTVHQPMAQSIKRTYVPHHIYNEIPIMVSQTKQYQEQEQEQEGLNEADERMLEQYEKLYGNYMEEKAKNEHLERQLREFELRTNERQSSPTRIQEITKVVTKPVRVDIKMLAQLIASKNRTVVNELFERRKRNCLNNVHNLFAEEQASIKNTLVRSSQEILR